MRIPFGQAARTIAATVIDATRAPLADNGTRAALADKATRAALADKATGAALAGSAPFGTDGHDAAFASGH